MPHLHIVGRRSKVTSGSRIFAKVKLEPSANVFNNVGLRKFRFPVNRMPSNGADWPMVDFMTLDCKGKMDKYSEDYLGYLASFEDLYEEILQARLKLDAKIKEANEKFPNNLEINESCQSHTVSRKQSLWIVNQN
ncbi:hypothetical protein LXL04_020464 [Taraxacum kok-saghyz]